MSSGEQLPGEQLPSPVGVSRRLVTWSLALRLLLILSVIINVALVRRVQIVQEQLAAAYSRGAVKVGSQVGPLDALSPEGRPIRLLYADVRVPTLLYFLAPTCGYCKLNQPNVNALIDQAKGRYRVVLLSPVSDGTEEYRHSYGISTPIFVLSQQSQRDLQLGGTPATFLVSPSGTVLGIWPGAFNADQQREIEQHLNVALPGFAKRP